MIDILITINNSYLEPCIVTLNSLFINNRYEKFHVHIIHYNLKKESIEKLSAFILKNKAHCSFYKVNDLEWANGKTRYWDKSILLKLYSWMVLPKQVKKVLYLDSDIIVLGCINELWQIDLKDFYFAMRGNTKETDLSGVYARHSYTGHINYVIKKERYDLHYNAGVILFNLDLLRHDNPQWQKFFLDNLYRLFCPEEHLICMLWYDKILPIKDKWNQIAQAHPSDSPRIIHYIPKPWSPNKDAYYLREYLFYCDIPECKSLYNKLLPRINAPYPHSKESFFESWLQIEIKRPNYIFDFLSKRMYNRIAIFGINQYSEILYCKLSTQNVFHIVFFIADNNCEFRTYNYLPVYRIDDITEVYDADCIIVSDYERFAEIEIRLMRKHFCVPIISIIEIIYS